MISPSLLQPPPRPVMRLCLQFEFEFRLNEFSCVFFMTLDFFTDAGKFTTKLEIRFDWGIERQGGVGEGGELSANGMKVNLTKVIIKL